MNTLYTRCQTVVVVWRRSCFSKRSSNQTIPSLSASPFTSCHVSRNKHVHRTRRGTHTHTHTTALKSSIKANLLYITLWNARLGAVLFWRTIFIYSFTFRNFIWKRIEFEGVWVCVLNSGSNCTRKSSARRWHMKFSFFVFFASTFVFIIHKFNSNVAVCLRLTRAPPSSIYKRSNLSHNTSRMPHILGPFDWQRYNRWEMTIILSFIVGNI